ncbi:hypothetical protein HZ993_14265 [Rhodoferax sp. AJA081-3]|uniref:hypothetical protein n=1 Tax=Rhodoferax sp. AJA081-3 TaxID=2752316 RepID=UPI001ADF9F22|nr:hypothetical protein [Rhodoferax sp. AJA081-3]QTN26492.1 hypothetical protein HZ993_14265 [Rhodoferax sp. AJA081-3]
MKRHLHDQRGFAAVAAIFLVLMLAALGAFMISFSNTQQLTSAQDVQGSRAYWAARAGLEWAVTTHIPVTTVDCSSASTDLAIEGFTVTVACTRATYTDTGLRPGEQPRVFQFTATARSAGTVGSISYIERSVSTSLEI